MNTVYDIGYVYKLTCSETGDIYFGSTVNLISRYRQHCWKDNKCMSRYLIKPTLDVLETKINISRDELRLIEKNYILNNTCINKNIPKRSFQEWYQQKKKDNPDYLKEQYQLYGGKLRNFITRKQCECGGKYVQRNLKRHIQSEKHKKYISSI
jgi:hypothetical protein